MGMKINGGEVNFTLLFIGGLFRPPLDMYQKWPSFGQIDLWVYIHSLVFSGMFWGERGWHFIRMKPPKLNMGHIFRIWTQHVSIFWVSSIPGINGHNLRLPHFNLPVTGGFLRLLWWLKSLPVGDFTCRKQGRVLPALSEPRNKKLAGYFPLNPGCLIGICVMVYYIPHPYNNGSLYSPFTWVVKSPIYPKINQGFFFHCSSAKKNTAKGSWMPVALQGTKINACLAVRHSVWAGRSEAKFLMNRCI